MVVRTPSPAVLPSSPPPTNKAAPQNVALSTGASSSANDIPTPSQISAATVDDLRTMVSGLSLSLRESRTAAAHYKLQHNMLLIDSAKASNAMAAELAMMQREVDVLQEAEERRRLEAISPAGSFSADALPGSQQSDTAATTAYNSQLIHDLSRETSLLQSANTSLRSSLFQSRRALEARDARIAALEEENDRLRNRIRKNREHVNGLLDAVFSTDRSPRSAAAAAAASLPPPMDTTPTRTSGGGGGGARTSSYFGTPRRATTSAGGGGGRGGSQSSQPRPPITPTPVTPSSNPRRATVTEPSTAPPARRERNTGVSNNLAFDALLLADKVLSQESAGSTPKRGRGHGHAHDVLGAGGVGAPVYTPVPAVAGGRPHGHGHVRASASLGSLPSVSASGMAAPGDATSTRGGGVRVPAALARIVEPMALEEHSHSHSHSHARTLPPPLPAPPVYSNPSVLAGPQSRGTIMTPGGTPGGGKARRRRRASSDSTITASSVEDEMAVPAGSGEARSAGFGPASASRRTEADAVDEIPESQASQVATSLLRRSSERRSDGALSSAVGKNSKAQAQVQTYVGFPPHPPTAPTTAEHVQAKIVGRVTKPGVGKDGGAGVEKRRLVSGMQGREEGNVARGVSASPKKRRVENVGLGIGI